LAAALFKAGYSLSSLTAKTLQEAEESSHIIGEGKPGTDNIRAAEQGDIIIITVPDDLIGKIAKELASPTLPWKDKQVFHCSGLHSSQILKPLEKLGAATASFHPIQTFPSKKADPGLFKNIYVSLEGNPRAQKTAEDMITKIGGRTFSIQAKDKPLYHSACSIASNLLVVLLDTAFELFKQTGISEKKAFEILYPLIKRTLQNVKDFSIPHALTGPVKRGDIETISQHLRSLKEMPEIRSLYIALTSRALQLAENESDLSSQRLRKLRELLEEK
jgi:predicted short-subunit dehydrogenase-like oxidoreductase (DUF2520 family)